MNINAPHLQPTTTAAEGLPRRRFTVVDVERMTAAGILAEDERIELIGGEVVPMSPRGRHHEILKIALMHYWARILPNDLLFATETMFRLNEDTFVEPDFVFYPKASGWDGINPQSVRLVIEVSDSSLGYDLGRKADLYGAYGIVELWVIDAVRLKTRIHRDPSPEGYRYKGDFEPGDRLLPQLMPSLAVILSELDLR